MIRQIVEPRKVSGGKAALLIVGAVAGLYALSFVIRLTQKITGLVYAPLILWLAAGAGVFALMNRYLKGYIYTLDGGNLYIERTVGTHSRVILQMPVSRLLEIKPCPPDGEKARDKLVCRRNDLPVWRLRYQADAGEKTLDMQVGKDFIEALTKETEGT